MIALRFSHIDRAAIILGMISVAPFVLHLVYPPVFKLTFFTSFVYLIWRLLFHFKNGRLGMRNMGDGQGVYIAIAAALVTAIFVLARSILDNQETDASNFVRICVACVYVYAIYRFWGVREFSRYYVLIMVVVSMAAAFSVVATALSGSESIFQIENPDGRPNYFYVLSFSNSIYAIGELRIIRASGLFDEPGAFALYCCFALMLTNYFHVVTEAWARKVANRILILGVISSFSMGGLIVCAMMLLSRIIVSTRAFVLFLLVLFATSVWMMNSESPVAVVINKMVIERITQPETEKNLQRTSSIQSAWNVVSDVPIWGAGWRQFEFGFNYDPTSIAGYMAIYGIGGWLLYAALPFTIIVGCVVKMRMATSCKAFAQFFFIAAIVLFMISQRPDIYKFLNFILLQIVATFIYERKVITFGCLPVCPEAARRAVDIDLYKRG